MSTLVLVALVAALSSPAEWSPTAPPVSERSPVPSSLPPDQPDVPARPGSEQVVITQEELDRQIAEHARSFAPARDVRAEIDPSGIAIRFSVYGLGGTFKARPVARDGTIALEEARVEGLLGVFLDTGELRAQLVGELQQHLAGAGVTVEAVTLERGHLVVTVSRDEHALGTSRLGTRRVR
jgi:hypothetical protein